MTEKIATLIILPRKSGAIQINAAANFSDKEYVDIRYMYRDKKTKELKPTQKGILLTHREFQQIAKYFVELQEDPVQHKRMRKLRKAEKLQLEAENLNPSD